MPFLCCEAVIERAPPDPSATRPDCGKSLLRTDDEGASHADSIRARSRLVREDSLDNDITLLDQSLDPLEDEVCVVAYRLGLQKCLIYAADAKENATKDTTLTTSWQRFLEKLKDLPNRDQPAFVQNTPPPQGEKDVSQLESWEDEGGKSAGRAL